MASWIARHQGLGAWASMPTHPREFAQAMRALREGEDRQFQRRATGLAANGNSASGNVHKNADGHVEAHIHVHGNAHKTTLKVRGAIEAKLHRWPVMSDTA
jgi:hypothetical protein